MKWTKDEILYHLKKNDSFIMRSIIQLYHRQTEDEQDEGMTAYRNGIGFNGVDSTILTSFAKQALRRKFLSPKQMVIARKKIMKYAGQITEIANEIAREKQLQD